ncbi:O-antigen ligase family protein [Aeoliella sp. ICT_H6.2]|uniref:O-antigen ligase family protein n=1 Tax=Aeoliella straminimaris TaxID=2954799 RepID=A0A9X2FEA5_9BACT|nr:O-antigen ligase family protein [Aeoliella straminimaris]MCO6047430.1 O-antigen ligase family protein [Aeoliella straminimaris]
MQSRSATALTLNPAFLLGSLIAIYFLIGRWTFARLSGDYDQVPLFEQPRVWTVAMIIVLAGIVFTELRHRGSYRPQSVDVAIIVWFTYVLMSAIWAPDAELAAEKFVEVAMMLVVAVAIAMVRSPDTQGQALLGFWWTLVAMGAAMGLLALYMSTGGRVFTPTGGPNIFGRNMGLTGIGALMLATRSFSLAKVSLYTIVLLSAVWVVMCGSRGALLATGVAGIVLFLTARVGFTTKITASLAFSIAAIFMFANTEAGRNATDVFRNRILRQTIEQRYTADRDDLFIEAYELGMEKPIIGWGLSGFLANSWIYPHNLFLETFAEGGMIGVLLLMWIFWKWWTSLRRDRRAMTGTSLAAMVLLVVAASFSGNYYDSRGVFLFLALSVEAIMPNRLPALAPSPSTVESPALGSMSAAPVGS